MLMLLHFHTLFTQLQYVYLRVLFRLCWTLNFLLANAKFKAVTITVYDSNNVSWGGDDFNQNNTNVRHT